MDGLKELMGDSYKDGMTAEEIGSFFNGKKYADLSTGNYVDKNKYSNEVSTLQSKLKEKEDLLNSKLTDDEKLSKAQADKDAEIENLKKMLKDNTITGNKNTVISTMASVRELLDTKVEDKDFNSFVENVTTEDSAKSNDIAKYVAKITKDAYEKGKKDAIKDAMGNLGKGKGNDGGSKEDDIGSLGKKLAPMGNGKKEQYDYFAKK